MVSKLLYKNHIESMYFIKQFCVFFQETTLKFLEISPKNMNSFNLNYKSLKKESVEKQSVRIHIESLYFSNAFLCTVLRNYTQVYKNIPKIHENFQNANSVFKNKGSLVINSVETTPLHQNLIHNYSHLLTILSHFYEKHIERIDKGSMS